jgi:hypothetical protein
VAQSWISDFGAFAPLFLLLDPSEPLIFDRVIIIPDTMHAEIRRFVHFLVQLTLLLSAAAAAASQQKDDVTAAAAAEKMVVVLSGKDFDSSIKDPKHPFWLLKFYAPW